jgi:copper chaperone CopZ
MSDRYNAITVVLEKDTRDDDAQDIIAALKMVKGVADAKPNIVNVDSFVSDTRARQELGSKLFEVLYDKYKK